MAVNQLEFIGQKFIYQHSMTARALKLSWMVSESVGDKSTPSELDDNFNAEDHFDAVVRGTPRVTWGPTNFRRDDGTGTHSNYDMANTTKKLITVSRPVAKRATKGVLKLPRPVRVSTFFEPNQNGKATRRNLNTVIAINANLRLEIERLHLDVTEGAIAKNKSDLETTYLLDKVDSSVMPETNDEQHEQEKAWRELRIKFPSAKAPSAETLFSSEPNEVGEMESEFTFPATDSCVADGFESDHMVDYM